ncbi:MAG: DegT/DnrJ/EryC1/StrS family aminotransferase [Negativicutes bacterium]|nr:DegT/DnrJ/EryC1/StrS family aminotransferase [Negativicutes bacterium]
MSDEGYELEYIRQAFADNWVAPLGPNVDRFERELAEYVGVGHAAALSSGTAALHLALRLAGVGPGDTVCCSSFTFIASANPILYLGATPVFIDSDPGTWNMSPAALRRALASLAGRGKPARAVVVVDLYGQSADYDQLRAACADFGAKIIEDAAEALGAEYKGKKCGSLAELAVFSFNGNKIITSSGGGMLVGEDGEMIERARFWATQARDRAIHYQHSQLGYNYRMSNVVAGIGRGQLRVLDQRVAGRREVFERYRQKLEGAGGISFMPEAGYGRSTRWLTAMVLDREQGRVSYRDVYDRLAEQNIESRPLWKPLHLQPLFAGCEYYSAEDGLDVCGDLFFRGLCLPSGSNLDPADQDRIIDIILSVAG